MLYLREANLTSLSLNGNVYVIIIKYNNNKIIFYEEASYHLVVALENKKSENIH